MNQPSITSAIIGENAIRWEKTRSILTSVMTPFNDTATNGTDVDISGGRSMSQVVVPLYLLVCVGVVNAIIFIVGIVGNFIVIVVICKVREMRISTNYCLLNLSIADMLVLLICTPSALTEFYLEDRWVLGDFVCKMVPFLENCVVSVSILTMLLIGIERYIAICHPLRAQYMVTGRRMIGLIALAWLLASTIALPFAILSYTDWMGHHSGVRVIVCRTPIKKSWHHIYLASTLTLLFGLPAFTLVLLYSMVVRQLLKDSRAVGESDVDRLHRRKLKQRRQVVVMLILVVLLFLVCLIPFKAITVWLIYASSENIGRHGFEGYLLILWFARIMMYTNSSGNPIIYALASTKFRLAMGKAFPMFRRAERDSMKRSDTTTTGPSYRYSSYSYSKQEHGGVGPKRSMLMEVRKQSDIDTNGYTIEMATQL